MATRWAMSNKQPCNRLFPAACQHAVCLVWACFTCTRRARAGWSATARHRKSPAALAGFHLQSHSRGACMGVSNRDGRRAVLAAAWRLAPAGSGSGKREWRIDLAGAAVS